MKKHILITLLLITSLVFTSVSQVNYQWVKAIGGTNGESGLALATDKKGHVYITGKVGSSGINFNIYGTTPVNLNLNTVATSAFIAKYDSVGNCIWAKSLQLASGTGFSISSSIAVDDSGGVYITGVFAGSIDFNTDNTATEIRSSFPNGPNPSLDGFLAKYDRDGNFKWVSTIGGKLEELTTTVVVDDLSSGLYISGTLGSDTAIFSQTTDTLFNKGGKDAFIAKFDTTGVLSWYNVVGGNGNDFITDIDADETYLVVTGIFQDTIIFNENNSPDTLLPYTNVGTFFGKYMLDGTYGWMDKIGGNFGEAISTGIALENSHIHLTGVFTGTINVDPTNNSTTLTSSGLRDVFVTKHTIGGGYAWKTRIGSEMNNLSNSASSKDIVVDENDNVYLAGSISGTIDFDETSNNLLFASNGPSDIYFSKLNSSGVTIWVKTIGSNLSDTLASIAIDSKNNVYLSGEYKNSVDFDPGNDVANRTSVGYEDMFIAKYAQGADTITGTVKANGVNVEMGINYVKLYTQITNDGNLAMHLVDSVSINSDGVYTFYNVPEGSYYLLAKGNSLDYGLYPATYYGNSTQWQQAIPVIVTGSSISQVADISMNSLSPFTGNATLSGYVLEGGGYDRDLGDPIPGKDIGLEGDPGSIMAHTETDENGYYEFKHVPAGCYKIYVNIPGLPMDSTYHECPTPLDSILNLDFIADSSGIDINPVSTNISQINKSSMKMLVYPNPNKGIATIEFTVVNTDNVQLCVYNLLGEKVTILLDEEKQAGTFKYQFNAVEKELKSGIYLLSLKIGNEISTRKIIQMD